MLIRVGCLRGRVIGETPQIEALAAAGEHAADAAEPDDADRGTPQAGRAVRLAATRVNRVTTRERDRDGVVLLPCCHDQSAAPQFHQRS
jgi:hypothetical protein